MWENIRKIKRNERNTSFFLDWMQENVMIEPYLRQANDLFIKASQKSESISKLKRIPQSAPWHIEGRFASDGVVRMLAGIYAIQDGAHLLHIEELARHKILEAEVEELNQIICENAATLQTFALVHDIAKAETLSFDSPEGSLGEREGFFKHKHRKSLYAGEQEIELYNKLFRAFEVANQDLNESELVAEFYDKYEIKTHYFDHAKIGASDKYFEDREKISDMLRLGEYDRRMLTFLVRNHMEIFSYFSGGANPKKYELLVHRSHKAGFDADDALDLMLASSFLDSAIGSVAYIDQKFLVDTKPVINMMLSEEQVAGHRRELRREEKRVSKQRILKDALLKSNLSPDEVFLILEVPFGKERGDIMKKIYDLVEEGGTIDFGDKTKEIAERIEKARQIFDHYELS